MSWFLPKKWFFILRKEAGDKRAPIDFYMYRLKNGKFYYTIRRDDKCMLNALQALAAQVKFHAPAWLYKNGNMFGYSYTTGRVLLKRID